MAQFVEHRDVTREVVSSIRAGPTLRVFKKLKKKCCLCNYICKRLDFQVFSDKDDKPEAPRLTALVSSLALWDVKDPTHYSKRVGDSVLGVVV